MKKKTGRSGRPEDEPKAPGAVQGFGARLRQLREKRGLSQGELAEAAGATWNQISRYERDLNVPAGDRIVALARALRTTPDWLLVGTQRQDQPVPFKNLLLYERSLAIDKLPKRVQQTALDVLEALIALHRPAKKSKPA